MSIVYSGSWSCENGTTIIITNKRPGQGERGNTKISTSTTAGRLSLNEQEPPSGLRAQKDKLASGMVPAIVAVCFCLFGHFGHGPDPILSILQLSLEHSRIIPVDNIIIIDATRLRAMIKQTPERRAVVPYGVVCVSVCVCASPITIFPWLEKNASRSLFSFHLHLCISCPFPQNA